MRRFFVMLMWIVPLVGSTEAQSSGLHIEAYLTEQRDVTPSSVLFEAFQDINTVDLKSKPYVWLKIHWPRAQPNSILINDYTQFGYIFYYPVRDGKVLTEWLGGHEHITSQRPNPDYRKFYVDISDIDFLLVKIHSHASMPTMFRLTNKTELAHEQKRETIWYTAAYAIIAAMILYNFFIFLYLRERQYFYYCLYLIAQLFTLVRLSGLGKQYIWPNVTQLSSDINFFSTTIVTVTGVLFIRSFLSAEFLTTLQRQAFNAIIAVSLLCFCGYTFLSGDAHRLHSELLVAGLLTTIFALIMTYCILVINMCKGDPNTKILILTYSILTVGSFIALAKYYGLIENHLFVEHALDIAVVLEAILLSLALAKKIDTLRKAKLTAEVAQKHQQQKFSQQLIDVQEKEKKQLGQVLHDDYMHRLLVIKQNLSKKLASEDEEITQINHFMNDLRNLSHRVHPHVVEQLGLSSALVDLVERVDNSTKIELIYHIENIPLTHSQSILVYRIVQESLSNIIKHAQAHEATVVMKRTQAGKVQLVIDDDGIGLASEHTDGFGLSSIKERCEMLDATLNINTSGRGTHIRIVFSPFVSNSSDE